MKPKDSRRKETTKMTVDINEIEIKETMEKIIETESWVAFVFENIKN